MSHLVGEFSASLRATGFLEAVRERAKARDLSKGGRTSVFIRRDNLGSALRLAIDSLDAGGYGRSGMCAGFREVAQALSEGRQVHVVD